MINPLRCQRCYVGIDEDLDGNCGFCYPLTNLKALLVKATIEVLEQARDAALDKLRAYDNMKAADTPEPNNKHSNFYRGLCM
jgi:rhamnogalacturonyl hydrolase YesR